MFINFEHIKNREHGKYVVQVLFFKIRTESLVNVL